MQRPALLQQALFRAQPERPILSDGRSYDRTLRRE